MPWQNNSGSGGPWGGGGGDGGSRNPWGTGGGGSNRPPGGGGRQTPDFDEFIRRSQERLRNSFPGGTGPSRPVWLYVILAIAAVWLLFSSAYRVGPQERGVVLRLGKYVTTTEPGFHFKMPWPIDSVIKPKVEQVNVIEIGSTTGGAENLMLTSDQNIIDIAYSVRWKIQDPERYLFQLADPELTIREVAESAMRARIADSTLDDAIGPQRAEIAEQVRQRMQELLNSYEAGVEVLGVDIRQADPPAAVDEAFKDVSTAQQEAQQYLNNARAYAQELIARAQGEAAVFNAVYAQYKLAPEVTRKRLYYETMEEVLGKVDKTIVGTEGVVPYLPLPAVDGSAKSAGAQPKGGAQ